VWHAIFYCTFSKWYAIDMLHVTVACRLARHWHANCTPRAVSARHGSMVSCHGYAACRDGMPPSRLFPETLIKIQENNIQRTAADFPGRPSETKPCVAVGEGFSKRDSQEMYIRRLWIFPPAIPSETIRRDRADPSK
jgi:hypothetical protein